MWYMPASFVAHLVFGPSLLLLENKRVLYLSSKRIAEVLCSSLECAIGAPHGRSKHGLSV